MIKKSINIFSLEVNLLAIPLKEKLMRKLFWLAKPKEIRKLSLHEFRFY